MSPPCPPPPPSPPCRRSLPISVSRLLSTRPHCRQAEIRMIDDELREVATLRDEIEAAVQRCCNSLGRPCHSPQQSSWQ